MNSYAHDFTPGFNWWYVLTVVLPIVAIIIGYLLPRFNRRGRITMIVGKRFANIIAGALSIAWMFFVLEESHAGLVQTFDNMLGEKDSPVWSLFLAVVTLGLMTSFMGFICSRFCIAGSNIKVSRLRKIRENIKKPDEAGKNSNIVEFHEGFHEIHRAKTPR